MDFLSVHHASIDCHRKEVAFRRPGEDVIRFNGDRKFLLTCMISALKASKLLRKGV